MSWVAHLPTEWGTDHRDEYHVLGLISDTHVPFLLETLPPVVARVFDGVDLILHAGDVGNLEVLEELRRIAPVAAIHGNDEPPKTTIALPRREVIEIPRLDPESESGDRHKPWRIGLTHGHHDREIDEMTARSDPRWAPKFAFLANQFPDQRVDAVVSGHFHIPFILRYPSPDGVLLVNPGALAPPNRYTEQLVQSIGLLFVHHHRPTRTGIQARVIDAQDPEQSVQLPAGWLDGVPQAIALVSRSWVAPEIFALAGAARLEARRRRAGMLRREHLLLHATNDPDSPASRALADLVTDLPAWRANLEAELNRHQAGDPPPTPDTRLLPMAPGLFAPLRQLVDEHKARHDRTPVSIGEFVRRLAANQSVADSDMTDQRH